MVPLLLRPLSGAETAPAEEENTHKNLTNGLPVRQKRRIHSLPKVAIVPVRERERERVDRVTFGSLLESFISFFHLAHRQVRQGHSPEGQLQVTFIAQQKKGKRTLEGEQ